MINYKIYGLRVIGTDEIRYVGYTKRTLKLRLYNHFYDCKRGLKYKKCYWIRKHNYNIEIILLEENLTYEEALKKEMFWITQYNNLLNMTAGGESNPMHNPETKAKHAEIMKHIDCSVSREKNWMCTEEGKKWFVEENKRRWSSGVYKNNKLNLKKELKYDELYNLYITEKKTLKECAEILNTTYRSVVRNLGRLKIKKYNGKKNN